MKRVASYTAGLLLALVLTVAAFSLAFLHQSGALTSTVTIAAVLTLAMVQLAAQLVFFLHLGLSREARWNSVLFAFTFFGILVIVVASVWIMDHLNYNMTPSEVDTYVTNQSSF